MRLASGEMVSPFLRRTSWAPRFAARVPYPIGIRILRRLCRSRLVQATLYRESVRAFRLFAAEKLSSDDLDTAIARHLLTVVGRRWRLLAVDRCEPSVRQDWFAVHGLETFDHAYHSGRGTVLLSSHFGAGRVVPLVLARRGYKILSLENADIYRELRIVGAPIEVIGLQTSFLPRAALQARRALEQGNVVHLTGDGNHGRSSVGVSFLRHKRQIASSFAQLAVDTGAVVVPVFAPINESGRISIQILPPLGTGMESQPRAQRVESLVLDYARLLEQWWLRDPGNVLPEPLGCLD